MEGPEKAHLGVFVLAADLKSAVTFAPIAHLFWAKNRAFFAHCLKRMAPRVRFERTTNRLTADCSTTELPRNRTRCLARLVWHDQKKFSPWRKSFRLVSARPLSVLPVKRDTKNEAGCEPGPKDVTGNGGVSSRKTRGSLTPARSGNKRLIPQELAFINLKMGEALEAIARKSNRGSRICNPLRNHSATWPH